MTGLYYYGARYYDSRTSIWLSTDPLQEKYPNISTYAYAFLNPIKFIDPTGMDGEVTKIDGAGTKKDPHIITIRAEYYYVESEVAGDFKKGLDNSIAEYNGLNSTMGNEKDGTYTVIKYNLSSKSFKTLDEAYDAVDNSFFENSNGDKNVSRYGNILRVTQGSINPDPEGISVMGNDNGVTVRIFDNVIEHTNKKTNISIAKLAQYVFGHEIGHNLGAEHGDASPMGEKMAAIPYKRPGCLGGESCIERWDINNDNKNISKKLAPILINRMNNPVGSKQYLYYKK